MIDFLEVKIFVDTYLRHVHDHKKGNQIEIQKPGIRTDHLWFQVLSVPPPANPKMVPDPVPYLNDLLCLVMKARDDTLLIPQQVIEGFSNCGRGFYWEFHSTFNKGKFLSRDVRYPSYLVVPTDEGGTRWTRRPESAREQMLHFVYHLRQTMTYLAGHPIGKKTMLTAPEVAAMLTRLPKRWAYVRSGDEVGTVITDDTAPLVDRDQQWYRHYIIQAQTRAKYCRPIEPPNVAAPAPEQPPFSRWEEVK